MPSPHRGIIGALLLIFFCATFAQAGPTEAERGLVGAAIIGLLLLTAFIIAGIDFWKEHKKNQEFKAIKAALDKKGTPQAGVAPVKHPSYRLSAWAWFLFWLLVALPFLLMAGRIVRHFFAFSWAGLQEGIAEAGQLITAWDPMPVDGLFLMPLLGFIGFKLHGRYSMPKEFRPRIRPMYATAKLCFFILSLVTMYYSLTRISHHVDNIVETGILQEPEQTPQGEEQVRTTILAAVTKAAAKRDFDQEISDALDRQDIAHAGIYLDLAGWLGIKVSPDVWARYQETQGFSQWMTRNASDCAKGAVFRDTKTLTQIFCILVSEFSFPLFADVADLVRQLIYNPFTGQKTDPFIVLGAAAGRVFDRRATMLKQAAAARHLRQVASKGGVSAAVITARYADNVDELRFAGRVANQFEKRTAGVLHLLGKRTFGLFKHYRIAKAVQLALGGWAGLWALAMTTLLSCLFSTVRSRVLRIITLRFLRRWDERRMELTSPQS